MILLLAFFLFANISFAAPLDIVVRQGNRGGDVENVQIMLFEMGFYRASVDGVFGAGTEAAVKAFQNKIGVYPDGIVTDELLRVITHYSGKINTEMPSRYSRKIVMEATAYTTEDPGCGLYTARGNRLRKGLVAVDPRVIPLGTRLYIVGYGPAVADDTGGAIKGNKIDLAYESRAEALQFGRRMVTVYIID